MMVGIGLGFSGFLHTSDMKEKGMSKTGNTEKNTTIQERVTMMTT